MARFGLNDVDNYGSSGNKTDYFSLKDDRDTARVRFMYRGAEDVEGIPVHEVEVNGKRRWVACLREYGQPLDACPMCKSGSYQNAKFFVPLYNIDEDKIQIWERGKKFAKKLSSICSRYSNLVSHTFEIERNGAKGDQATTYEIYETGQDDIRLEDLPEVPDVVGGIVLDKTAEEMRAYISTGSFPNASAPAQSSDEYRRREPERRDDYARRTPATSDEDKF